MLQFDLSFEQHLGAYQKSDPFWISATDIGQESSFYWDSNGKLLGLHTDWAENQPDNANGIEHCVNLGIDASELYQWSDLDCKTASRYLCEEKLNGLTNSKADSNTNFVVDIISF
jgi:Lectin C-type domain